MMKSSFRRCYVALQFVLIPFVGARAQTSPPAAMTLGLTLADSSAVRRAALDYLEGFYEGDTAKLIRSVRPNVAKYGLWRARDSVSFQPDSMNYAEFLSYARRLHERGTPANPKWPKEVIIFDIQSRTASAKVVAWWGTDYLLLGKFGNQWMITHVMWQSPPKAS